MLLTDLVYVAPSTCRGITSYLKGMMSFDRSTGFVTGSVWIFRVSFEGLVM